MELVVYITWREQVSGSKPRGVGGSDGRSEASRKSGLIRDIIADVYSGQAADTHRGGGCDGGDQGIVLASM